MCIDIDEWRGIRHECYRGVREVAMATGSDQAERAYELQKRAMYAIMNAETSGHPSHSAEFKRHVHLLRLCIDSLAFLLLHPHTIRQLGKIASKPPRLSEQRNACLGALGVAREQADKGVPALISELTNLIRISDVVVVDDLEQPTLVECKSKLSRPEFIKQGRRGRQVSRALGTMNYLQHGTAKVFGEEIPRLALDSKVLRKKSQDVIERVVAEAMMSGSSHEFVSPHDLVICVRPGSDATGVDMEPYMPLFSGFRQTLIGSYACALWNPDMLIPPAIIWDLDYEPATALMEEELLLIHAIDLMHFCDIVYNDFRVVEVVMNRRGSEGAHIKTLGKGGSATANISFVNDVLFWYYSIESTIEALRELHGLTFEALSNGDHEQGRCIDPSQLSVTPSTCSSHQNSKDTLVGHGTYRVRLPSGDEFVIQQNDSRETGPGA